VRIVTIEGETIYANRAILDIYGYDSIEELKTTPTEKRYTPESYAEHQIRREKRKRGDDVPTEYEISIVRKDGEVRHLQIFRKEISWDAERQFQVLYSDITERKRAEDALRISEEQFRRLSEATFEAIAIHDEGVLLNANNQFFEMFGYEPGEVIGKQVMPMTVAPEAREFMTKKIATGDLGPYESIGLRKDGTRFPMEIRTRHMKYKEHNIRFGAIRDITKSKQADEMLRQSEEKYRDIFDETVEGIYRSTPAGHFLIINPAFARICGYASPEEMKDKVTDIANHLYANPEDRLRFQKLIAAEGEVKGFEVQFKEPTRGLVWISINSKAFRDEQGNIQYYSGAIEDITSRKQAEEEARTSRSQLRALAGRLQQIREEERLIVAREIHDEMGGGLTGLKMDLSWLLRKMGNADPGEERVALMDKIHTSNALIDQMIKIVRRISTDLRPSVLDDLGLIAALEWQLSEFTSHTGIPHEFVTTVGYVNMEKDTAVAVFRIFQEALTNVSRHSQATKVTVVLREEERSLFGDESFVLEIRDNGRGITEEEILNPESLGLLGMKERVLAFGGELSIRGEPGGGTVLVLKIPRIQGEPS
jgi:PAS domain S-box-containing protein